MKLTYGSYEHDDNEVSFTISKQSQYNNFQQARGHRATWVITGVKQAASVSALTTALSQLESAYGTDGGDLIFYDNSNSETAHSIRNSDTFGGVRIKEFRYLDGNNRVWGSGAEYVNIRTYRIVVEADVLVRLDMLAYSETVMTVGGGPQRIWVPSATGLPQEQLIRRFTPYKAVQIGLAVGDITYPPAASPIWPEPYYQQDKTQGKLHTPRFVQGGMTDYKIEWSYHFESDIPLVGSPTIIVR